MALNNLTYLKRIVIITCLGSYLAACSSSNTGVVNSADPVSEEPKKCMLIGAAPGEENEQWNKPILENLRKWGYEVDRLHTRTEILEYSAEDFTGYDFIFLSETLDSRQPGMDTLRRIPLPMVNSDGWGAKDAVFAFGGEQGILEPATPVEFLTSAKGHGLAQGYSPGDSIELGSKGQKNCLLVWGTPTMEVVAIAGVKGDTQKLAVYGIEKGMLNAAGEAIEHRVATIGTHAWCYDNLSDHSVNLFNNAIEWVLAEAN